LFSLITDILIFVLGLCLGSFLNVVIYRLPKEGQSILRPRRSVCPSCRAPIAWYDNLPLVSFFVLGGRCRHCRQPISWRYPLVELMAGLLTLAVFYQYGFSFRTLAGLYLVLALIAITYIDLDEMVIPDALTLPGMALALAAAVISPDPGLIGPWLGGRLMEWDLVSLRWLSLIGSGLGLVLGGALVWIIFQVYYLVRKEEGIGGGDFTLLAMIGAFLGWRAVLFTVFLGSIAGVVAVGIMAAREKELSLQMKLPFGPFLALAALIYLFFGEAVLRWYWS